MPELRKTPDDLQEQITGLMKQYRTTPDGARTALIHKVAECLVEARSKFTRHDGQPDWRGQTYPYRMFVSNAYGESGLSPKEIKKAQGTIRYHVGEILHEKLTPETLADYGLLQESPKERGMTLRDVRSAYIGSLADMRDARGGSIISMSAAWVVLSKIRPEALRSLDERERGIVEGTLTDIEAHVAALRAALTT